MKPTGKVMEKAARTSRLSLIELDSRRPKVPGPGKGKGVYADTPCVCTSPLTTPYVTVREGGGPQPFCLCVEDATVSKQVTDKPVGSFIRKFVLQ